MAEKLRYYEECCPITSLSDITEVINKPPEWIARTIPLEQRSTTVIQNTRNDCHVEADSIIPSIRMDRRFVPKTLVCHDYKGGYTEDRYLFDSSTGNEYTFYHWAHIDIFIYFSHNLITIPPLCWINAAHKNGVKILGAFIITDSSEGTINCQDIFQNDDTMRNFATYLVNITKLFKFDGWLVNIENCPTTTIDILKKFLSYLTIITHHDDPAKLIIWYDSVTTDGNLERQNELNSANKYFFDHCDGIFLNYFWTEKELKNSVEAAKYRNLDVFVGIDVYGRGDTFGGGKFNSYLAAQIIRQYNLSIAIFAPGWTHESLSNNNDNDQFYREFINRDSAFWNSLWPFLYTHPITSFFSTDFYIGMDQSNYNMFCQQFQLSKMKHPKDVVPVYSDIIELVNKCKCIQCDFKEHDDMKCLITTESFTNSTNNNYIHRLFLCNIQLVGGTNVFLITENMDQNPTSQTFILLISENTGSFKEIRLNSEYSENLINNSTVMEINPAKDRQLVGCTSRSDILLQFDTNITVFIYNLTIQGTLLEVGCKLNVGQSIYLRAFGIDKEDDPFFSVLDF